YRDERGGVRAAADGRAESHAHAGRAGCRQVEEAAAEKEVRRRAERHRGSRGCHSRAVPRRAGDAVRVDAALAQEAVVILDIEVAAAPWKELRDPRHLVAILRNVRLQVDAGMLLEQPAAEI